jgi:O-antigen/teichoic acid export membrane protein
MLQKLKNLFFSKTGKNIIFVYFFDIVILLIGAVTAIILIRNLSEADYGLYTYFIAVANFITGVIGGGLNNVTTRYAAEYISVYKKKPIHVYGINLFSQIFFSLLLLGIILPNSKYISRFFFGSILYSGALLLGVLTSIGFVLVGVGRTIFQSLERFKIYSTLGVIQRGSLLVGILFLLKTKRLDFNHVAILWLGILFILGIGLIFLIKEYFTFPSGIKDTKEMLSGGGWLIVYFLFLSLFNQLDIFMLSKFRSIEEVAVYGVAFKYHSLILLVLGSISAVLLPKFSKMDYRDLEVQKRFINRWIRLSTLSIFPIGLLILFSKPVMVFLNGPRYLSAILPFQLFCVGAIISLMFSPLVNIVMARKKYFFLAVLGFTAFFINFIGNYLFIPLYGIIGATGVTVVSYAVINLVAYFKICLDKN